jgi:integrase
MLFWTGMRPSEAAGLRWTDMDLEQRQGRVQGSRHSYFRSRKTKTKAARRTVQFTSETTALLKSIMPLHVEPDTPVFTNVDGEPSSRRSSRLIGTTACARSASARAACTAPRTRSARWRSRAA